MTRKFARDKIFDFHDIDRYLILIICLWISYQSAFSDNPCSMLICYTCTSRCACQNIFIDRLNTPKSRFFIRHSLRAFIALFFKKMFHLSLWINDSIDSVKAKFAWTHSIKTIINLWIFISLWRKTEVPRNVQNSKVRKEDNFRRDWSQYIKRDFYLDVYTILNRI